MKGFNAAVRMFLAGVLMITASSATAQQTYPAKPIRMIVPYPPGGGSDLMGRLVGQKLLESWGQPVLIDNRGGGNTIIGTEALVKSPPDGYTIFLTASPLAVLPHLYRSLPYDTLKDIAPVATFAIAAQVFVVNPSVAAANLQEFIALAKAKPGQLNFASSGSGGPAHLAGELFNLMTGVQMQHIPFKGTAQALTALISGDVQVFSIGPMTVIPHIKAGRLRAVAITGENRLAALSQVPTFAEAGLPGFDLETWYGIVAPAGAPKSIITRLSAEIGRAALLPDFKEKLEAQGMRPYITTAEQFTELLKSDLAKYGKIVKAGNIKIE